VDSRTTSRHHKNIQAKIEENPKSVISKPKVKPWKNKTLPVVKLKALIEVKKGRMLGSKR